MRTQDLRLRKLEQQSQATLWPSIEWVPAANAVLQRMAERRAVGDRGPEPVWVIISQDVYDAI